MSLRTIPPRPFWSNESPPNRLAGSWADLVGRSGAALGEDAVVGAYDRAASYALGALLDHPAFGVGVVVATPSPGKITVRFSDGDRLLICGTSTSQPR